MRTTAAVICALCYLFTSTLSLQAELFDWFSPQKKQQPSSFGCMHDCMGPGSQGLEDLELKAMQAIWEYDRMWHALNREPFEYSLPKSFENVWFLRLRAGFYVYSQYPVVNIDELKKYYKLTSEWNFSSAIDYWETESDERRWEYDRDVDDEPTNEESKTQAFEKGNWQNFRWFINIPMLEDEDNYCLTNHREIKCFLEHSTLNWFVRQFIEEQYPWNDKALEEIDKAENFYRARLEDAEKNFARAKERFSLPDARQEQWLKELAEKFDDRKKHLQRFLEVKESLIPRIHTDLELLSTHQALIDARLSDLNQTHLVLLDHCIENHKAPASYLARAQHHLMEGNSFEALLDVRELLENTPPAILKEGIEKEIATTKATAENEVGLFNEALLTLSNFLEKHPHNQQVLIEKAIAHFETENFYEAIEDFVNGKIDRPIILEGSHWGDLKQGLELSSGLIQGITKGAGKAAIEFVPGAISSLSALSRGLWAFAADPEDVSIQLVMATKCLAAIIAEQGPAQTLVQFLGPEAEELVHSKGRLSYARQGELVGSLIGRYGLEIFACLKGASAIQSYRALRKANAVLSVEKMALSAQRGGDLAFIYKDWSKNVLPQIDAIVASTKSQRVGKEIGILARELQKKAPLTENQVRQLLHRSGLKTFRRPKGIPHDCVYEVSKQGGGMVYRRLGTTKEECILVRVMPGNPHSPNAYQQKPYVVQRKGKKALTVDGELIPWELSEAHIPLEQYNFKGW